MIQEGGEAFIGDRGSGGIDKAKTPLEFTFVLYKILITQTTHIYDDMTYISDIIMTKYIWLYILYSLDIPYDVVLTLD